jgi:hypothetical protein
MGVAALVTASCASSQAPPLSAPTVNVTGAWVGSWTCDRGDADDRNGMLTMTLTQTGAQVTGQSHATNPLSTARDLPDHRLRKPGPPRPV